MVTAAPVEQSIRSGLLRWLRLTGLLVVVIVVIEYLVLPQLVSARQDVHLLRSAQPELLLIALGLEALSLASYSLLSQGSLRPHAPTYGVLLRIDLTGLGLSHVIPGGGATAAALRYRLLLRAGVPNDGVIAGTALQTAVSWLALVSVFVVGILLSLPKAFNEPVYLGAGELALALMVVFVSLGAVLSRRTEGAVMFVHRLGRRLSVARLAAVENAVTGLAGKISSLGDNKPLLLRTIAWALGNWVLDALCLWCCLRAYGFTDQLGPLLAIYGAVSLLAMLPLTPGGIGIVEAVLIPALVSVGAEASIALMGVLTWRLIEYWLPIPIALGTYLSLRLGALRHDWSEP